MAEWTNASLSLPAADELSAIQEALLGFASTFISINQDVILPILEVLALIQARKDVAATVAAAALDAAARLLDDFIRDSAGHLLVVNPLKPFGRAVAAPDFEFTDLAYLPIKQIIRTPSDTLIGDGGNFGLYRKIVESLYDQGDFSRPQMDPDSWVGGFVMVFGSDTYLDLIQGLLQLQDIFGPTIPVPMDGFALPVPQNLKARTVSVSNRETISGVPILDAANFEILGAPQTPPPYAVHFRWDPEPLVTTKPAFGRFRYLLKTWHVYAKPGGERILPGEDLSIYEMLEFPMFSGALGPEGDSDSEIATPPSIFALPDVIFTGGAYSTVIKNFDPDTTYHVAVAYSVEVEDQNEGVTKLFEPTYESLSAQRRINLSEQGPVSQFTDGRPPDWIAISSPLAPFPPIRQFLAEIQAGINVIRDTFADVNNELSSLIDYIRRRLQEIEDFIARLSAGFGILDNLFTGLDIGIWVATFQGRGGNPFFVGAMGDLFLDQNTVNRPPFDIGDEVLAGMVFLTESATVGAVEDFIAIGSLFTGPLETTGFTVSDINREEREEELTEEEAVTTQQSLVDLGLTDEDPC